MLLPHCPAESSDEDELAVNCRNIVSGYQLGPLIDILVLGESLESA